MRKLKRPYKQMTYQHGDVETRGKLIQWWDVHSISFWTWWWK